MSEIWIAYHDRGSYLVILEDGPQARAALHFTIRSRESAVGQERAARLFLGTYAPGYPEVLAYDATDWFRYLREQLELRGVPYRRVPLRKANGYQTHFLQYSRERALERGRRITMEIAADARQLGLAP